MELRKPALSELSFRRQMLADPETMAYNEKWGGTIDFSREKWDGWYARWVRDTDGQRFYRYLYVPEAEAFVGEAAYHFDAELGQWLADVIVYAPFRGRGYGREGLRLLVQAARENGLAALCDNIAADNDAALALFQSEGFRPVMRADDWILVKRELTDSACQKSLF